MSAYMQEKKFVFISVTVEQKNVLLDTSQVLKRKDEHTPSANQQDHGEKLEDVDNDFVPSNEPANRMAHLRRLQRDAAAAQDRLVLEASYAVGSQRRAKHKQKLAREASIWHLAYGEVGGIVSDASGISWS